MHFTKNLTCNTVIQGPGPMPGIQAFFRTRLVSNPVNGMCKHCNSSLLLKYTIENKVDTKYVSATPFPYHIYFKRTTLGNCKISCI